VKQRCLSITVLALVLALESARSFTCSGVH